MSSSNAEMYDETGDGGALSKDKITELLNRRHKKRQLDLDSVHELKNKESSETEGRDYFDQIFDTKTREIKNNLNNLQEGDKAELALAFNSIIQTIQELQRYLSSSTLFLTDYKIKMCQNVINELHLKCDEQKQKLIPKKKFGFKSKKAAVEVNLPSEDAAPAPSASSSASNVEPVVPRANKKLFEWTLSNRTKEFIRLAVPAEVNDKDLTLANLTDCIVEIQGHAGSLQMSHITNCIILTGPVARSVFADHCTDCHFAFACQQLRLHSSAHCDIYLHVTCRGIVEDCREIAFAEYNYAYDQLAEDYAKTALDRSVNRWQDIADFNWLSPDVHSPNWKEMAGEQMVKNWQEKLREFQKAFQLN